MAFTFKLMGRSDDWFVFRAPMWSTSLRRPLDASHFQTKVAEWLFDEAIGKWHLGNGNAHGYPALPQAFKTGSSLVLLLQNKVDVVRFCNEFAVSGMAKLDEILA